jgi:hypothetical protein
MSGRTIYIIQINAWNEPFMRLRAHIAFLGALSLSASFG